MNCSFIHLQEANRSAGSSGSGVINAPEGKKLEHGSVVYESKEVFQIGLIPAASN